ncbi:Serine--tRNA ligase [Labeo rohita]|uniref:Serine--tRNA ligase n=1 Tax=Labeo rohita TaxID=84645 RepID=A0ABQ8MV65_LABRO|nr:Serine--tRNA ligase [Labeo rohita]
MPCKSLISWFSSVSLDSDGLDSDSALWDSDLSPTRTILDSDSSRTRLCVGTSSNLATSLFPILKKAVELNKPDLAKKYLDKAKTWIIDIIKVVANMVDRYKQQNETVATSTSDVFQEQKETKEKLTKQSDEMKGLEDALAKLEVELRTNVDDMKKTEKKLEETNNELQDLIRTYEEKKKRSWFFGFFRRIFGGYRDASKVPGVAAKTGELSRLDSEKNSLRNKEWDIKIKQTDLQLKLATSKIKMGEIPSPVHLTEVQKCLFQIQQILVDLQKFWEKVGVTLDTLKDKTFVGEDIIDLEDLKDEFLASIDGAEKYWQRFGACCQRAQGVFSIQSKNAYNFLEINPSSLSEEERKKQYMSVMEKLKKISPHGLSTAAITE